MRSKDLTAAAVALTLALTAGGCRGAEVKSSSDSAPSYRASLAATVPLQATTTLTGDARQTTEFLEAAGPVMRSTDGRFPLGTDFDSGAALRHVVRLSAGLGVRKAGSEAERAAARYVADELRSQGYEVVEETFPLPDGRTSRNVVAVKRGRATARVVIGAHMDSLSPSPGANDNATGVAAMLVIAEAVAKEPVWPTVEFVAYGAEESVDGDPHHHHYGSRYRVSRMSQEEKESTVAMFSVDMIGAGSEFHVRTMRRGPQTLADAMLEFAEERGVPMTFRADRGETGWSDHEPYELAGIPAVWVEWRDDPLYHTEKDTPEHLSEERIRVAGQLVLDFVRALDEPAAERLR